MWSHSGAGCLLAIPDDPSYPPLDIPADLPEEAFQVLGRQAGRWQDL